MEEKIKNRQQPVVEPQMPSINVNVEQSNVQQQTAFAPSVGGGAGGQVETKLTMMEILGHLVIWIVVSIFTAGLGLLFWPYASAKLILNSMVVDQRQIRCELGMGGQLGHMLIWAVLIVCSIGALYPFYFFGIVRTAINKSRLV